MERLRNKVCAITGGASGIGEASARLFAKEGAKIAVVDIDHMNGERVVGELKSDGADALFVEADVADAGSAEDCLKAIVSRFGSLDVVLNNAGVSAVGDVVECDAEDWERVMRINVRGIYLISHYAVPIMRQQGHGTIINMSSTIAVIGLQRRAAYAASKGAVLALTRAMAADHSHENIRVSALLPGTVYTPFVQGYLERNFSGHMEEAVATLESRQLNNELMTAEDVAWAALYLASDESRFALGTGLIIDGGVSAAKVF